MKVKILSALLLASVFCVQPALATEVSVSKLRINLEGGRTSDFLTVNNQSENEKQAYEISLLKWTQQPNPEYQKDKTAPALIEVLAPTENILASPKTIVIMPKQNKIIRLMINDNNKANKDYSYRLIVNQLPNKEVEAKTNTISLLFKVSLPVFVYDKLIENITSMKITKSVVTENGKQYVIVTNNDMQHIQIQSLDLGEKKFSLNKYVLPGSTERLELPADYKLDGKTPLTLLTDKGALTLNN